MHPDSPGSDRGALRGAGRARDSHRAGHPTEVLLGPDHGMPEAGALSFDNLMPVPKALLTERITRLRPAKLAELCPALNVAAGC